jgi:hypothetical protein
LFKENYLNKNPTNKVLSENIWYIRDLIYNDCYPEINIINKTAPNDSYIANEFAINIAPIIPTTRQSILHIQPFCFDAKQYLSKK